MTVRLLLISGGRRLRNLRREYFPSSIINMRLTHYSDISSRMSTLSLGKAASLQQEKDAQSQRPLYNVAPQTQEPLMAPQPQRASAPGVWTPDMPISFGSPAGGSAGPSAGMGASAQKAKADGRWDPNAGLRFG
jgi:hypothetical protein